MLLWILEIFADITCNIINKTGVKGNLLYRAELRICPLILNFLIDIMKLSHKQRKSLKEDVINDKDYWKGIAKYAVAGETRRLYNASMEI